MTKPKKLIEVAMPVKEISAESVRDKSIRHGHISTLHLWWARRPLPVCRAVVFASLVPDPLDENCPHQFKEAIEILIGKGNDFPGDPYKPYDDIPHTAIVDKMEDNLRNRLMMFIGKFSDKYVLDEKLGKTTAAKDLLHQYSLIKWDNKNDDRIIGRARKLIFVSHNAESGHTAKVLLAEFKRLDNNIKKAEDELYKHPNRHIETDEVIVLEKAKDDAIAAFLAKMPKVFDPFAGGGAIPLEAARLGCNSYGNDINPIAHIIQKGSCEFPQKYGKPITYSKEEFVEIYGEKELQKQQAKGNVFGEKVNITNRLAHDVEYFASKLLANVETEIGHYYPKNKDGKKPIVYYWARQATCQNPSCGAQVPMLRQFNLAKKRNKKIHLKPQIVDKKITFSIVSGLSQEEGWQRRGNLYCPCCHQITKVSDVKKQSIEGNLRPRLICVIFDSKNGKEYRIPSDLDLINLDEIDYEEFRPTERMQPNSAGGDTFSWGYNVWGQLFSNRQLSAMQNFVFEYHKLKDDIIFSDEYRKSILIYLSIWIDRLSTRLTSFGVWNTPAETLEHPFGRQAIPMALDFPESNPFCDSTGSATNQLEWIIRYINGESNSEFSSSFKNAASGEISQFDEKSIDIVVTDPPYYDAIAYADLSDFFYVWLKRTIAEILPNNFATPQTPKSEECTALKHHHNNNSTLAFNHFETKLFEIFKTINFQTKDLVSIMFAHQSTKAWTTLCNSILKSGMNLTSSWSNDTELIGALKQGAFLSSSITVSCKPSIKSGIGDYKEVRNEILKVIKIEVKDLYAMGFRGADLLTACFGQAVSVFGKYKSVEKADGSEVTVAELLDMAKEAAFDAIISDIDTDDLTKFYIGWLNLFGFSETNHDEVRRISQIGLSVSISDIYGQKILVKNGDKGTLGSMAARILADKNLGLRPVKNNDIDITHRLMFLFDPSNGSRSELLEYIAEKAPNSESPIWRVLNSLVELLPKSKELKDQELAAGLISNQENLIREAKNREESPGTQSTLVLE